MKSVGKKKETLVQPISEGCFAIPEQNPRFNTERTPEELEPIPEESRWLAAEDEDIMTEHEEQPPAGEGP
jgi:hypothetical protein